MVTYFITQSLPFEILPNQVFYIEDEYIELNNTYIRENYDSLKQKLAESISFRSNRFSQFIYLPILNSQFDEDKQLINYFLPQFHEVVVTKLLEKFGKLTTSDFSLYLLKSLGFSQDIKAGVLRLLKSHNGTIVAPYIFQYIELKVDSINEIDTFFRSYFKDWNIYPKITFANNSLNANIGIGTKFIMNDSRSQASNEEKQLDLDIRKTSDILFDINSHNISGNVKELVNHLSVKGYNSSLIDIIVKTILESNNSSISEFNVEKKISRVVIDRNYRIFLTDFNDLEISMTPLPKAIFLLFLKHPEGILFKQLIGYKQELSKIYRQISYRETQEEIDKSIAEIVNPLSNSINEKCSRIKEAFVKHFDDSIAKNYYIVGERGKEKLIRIDRNLVEYISTNYLIG